MSFVVAVDGPAASGKGTITRELARELGLKVLPTGDMYRCLALEVLRSGYGLDHVYEIVELAKNLNIQFKSDGENEIVFLNGEDVSEEIREPAISKISSSVSSIVRVREQMEELQRKIAEGRNIIAEGRDMGTVVFPNADVKLYIDASEEIRAKRRYEEYVANGVNTTYEEVLKDIQWRDNNDKHKEVGSLKRAEDAIYVDTTYMTVDEVVAHIKATIQPKIAEKDSKENNSEDKKSEYDDIDI